MTTDRRLPVMARIRVPKRTYAFQSPPCIPSQRCWPLGLTRLRLCTNFTLGTYGFPVCVLLSLNQRHLQTCSSEVLPCPSAPVALFAVPTPPRVLSVSLSFHILVVAHTWRVCVSNYLPPFPFVALPFSFEGHVRFHKRVGVALNPPANRTQISAFLLYPIFASFSCFYVRT